ncbi:MAG TPA: 16S rRNA (cytidine(1402)-2'-O)-methyltransferase [Epsilonproteobacteria bacterium]|nr:16S rRNA (cytidine(1402)-2'-O)-methyltransferase [Campylobacterota bacterium]
MLTLIPTPIGNPADITIRAMRLFEEAELFLCEDTRNTKHLMKLLEERFKMQSPTAKFLSFHEHNGHERLIEIAPELENKNVVYVSDAGMPVISDPGQILVAYCQENGISYDVLPGANAALTAYVASGLDSGTFCFMGFLPQKGKDRAKALKKGLDQECPVILYEAPHRLEKLLSEILELDANREIFLAKELTKKYQKYYIGNATTILTKLKDITIRGEWVVVLQGASSKPLYESIDEIIALSLTAKEKAKLLSQINGKSIKECYSEIIRYKQI